MYVDFFWPQKVLFKAAKINCKKIHSNSFSLEWELEGLRHVERMLERARRSAFQFHSISLSRGDLEAIIAFCCAISKWKKSEFINFVLWHAIYVVLSRWNISKSALRFPLLARNGNKSEQTRLLGFSSIGFHMSALFFLLSFTSYRLRFDIPYREM